MDEQLSNDWKLSALSACRSSPKNSGQMCKKRDKIWTFWTVPKVQSRPKTTWYQSCWIRQLFTLDSYTLECSVLSFGVKLSSLNNCYGSAQEFMRYQHPVQDYLPYFLQCETNRWKRENWGLDEATVPFFCIYRYQDNLKSFCWEWHASLGCNEKLQSLICPKNSFCNCATRPTNRDSSYSAKRDSLSSLWEAVGSAGPQPVARSLFDVASSLDLCNPMQVFSPTKVMTQKLPKR